jgi:hypothetical protein
MNFELEPERKSQNLKKNQYIFKGYPILYDFAKMNQWAWPRYFRGQ